MISFSCPSCQMKLSVKPEFAGRSSRCPTCKQPLTVPSLDMTQAYVPPQQIDGEESGLAKIGHEGGVTLDHGPAGRQPPPAPKPQGAARAGPDGRSKGKDRYVIEGELARGGMGAVLRATDGDLRREVAVKYMLDDKDPTKKARFIEEAQINAQLEHPNIVPVYDLRIDVQGRPYLMMKLVKGRDLKSVLDQLRDKPKQAEKEWSLGRLLNILVNVCNGLAFAHAHGVIHRDLKPANIMLGDFGEVYVMDWGLAKVLKGSIPTAVPVSEAAAFSAFMGESGAPTAQRSSQVVTNREPEADLTQVGAIMGTPVYMPPEQATGNVQAIDQRSDVYALGAILYEMLTLQPPIDTEGGYLAILMRVALGEIVPPEQRVRQAGEPGRVSARSIPPELAAIAMKALAKEPGQRYPNVGELRQDIERFQEGRSVSAKHDTFKEMAWKLVKRNKGVSIATAAALVVLTVLAGFFLKINYDARVVAETERGRAESEQNKAEVERGKAEVERNKAKEAYQAYLDQVKGSVPLLLRATRAALGERQYDDALVQASIAAKSAPDNADARLLKGQLLITRLRFAEAAAELEEYRKLKGEDAGVQKLAELCGKAEPKDVDSLMAIAEAFTQRGEHALADGVLSGEGKTAVEVRKSIEEAKQRIQEARQRVLEIYRKRIEAAWPGQGNKLTMNKEGQYSLNRPAKVTDLTPLRGMQLTALDLDNGNDQLRDLEPLKGMPLTSLDLMGCKEVRDLEPLKGMKLTKLYCGGTQVRDLSPLKGLPLTYLDIDRTQAQDLEPLKGMPLTSLNLTGCKEVRDLEPLKGIPLTSLTLDGTQVKDLSPLQGMPLTSLDFGGTQVQDLTPLQGMPLTSLNLTNCKQVQNLEPLQGMPLTSLSVTQNPQLRDLTPLKGMPLTTLDLRYNPQLRDLTPLKGMPLTHLYVYNTQVRDLTPLQGMPLTRLWIFNTGVSDLSPLQGMELTHIGLTPKNITQGLDILRESLKVIGIGDLPTLSWPAAEFWARYDKGEFKK